MVFFVSFLSHNVDPQLESTKPQLEWNTANLPFFKDVSHLCYQSLKESLNKKNKLRNSKWVTKEERFQKVADGPCPLAESFPDASHCAELIDGSNGSSCEIDLDFFLRFKWKETCGKFLAK